MSALSTYSTATGKARAVTVTGTHFHDVSRVYLDRTAVSFKKTGTTKLHHRPGILVGEEGLDHRRLSHGQVLEAFTYFTPLSSADRADYLFDLDCMQRNWAAPQAPVKAAYDAAVKYIRSPGVHDGAAYKQYLHASNAIDYTHYIRAANEANVEHGRMKTEYAKFLAAGDTAMADFYKGLMGDYASWRDEAKEDAAIALGNIKALGGKVG